MNSRATWSFCARAAVHVALRITHVIGIISASQLHFLANKNTELAGRSQWTA